MSSRLITRLTAPVFAVSIVLLGLGIGSAWYVNRLQTNTSELLRYNVDSVLFAQKLEISILEVRWQFSKYLRDGDKTHLDRVETLREQTEYWLFQAERTATSDRERALMSQIWAGYECLFEEYDRSVQKPFNGNLYGEVSQLIEPVLNDQILTPVHEYRELHEELLKNNSMANRTMAEWLIWALVLVGCCGAMCGLLIGLAMAWQYGRRMVQVYVRLRHTADQLNDVVGPITLTAGQGLRDLDFDLQRIGEPIRKVIKRLQQSQREVMRSEQLAWVGQIAAGIAHEVRNPLTTLKILVQAALVTPDERGMARLGGRDLQILEEEIGRLERLIGSFLEFARPPRAEKVTIELRPAVDQAIELVKARAEAAGVSVKAIVPKRPVQLDADPAQLHQVLFNLLLNAIQATEPGSLPEPVVEVETKVGRSRRGKRFVMIHVKDQGKGLPNGIAEDIFDPFVSTKESGMGLGLSICRRIVEGHGGRITAANRPCGGAVFTVTLPMSETALVPTPNPPRAVTA